uniref:TauD/TfdA-like domain-containing protein n=1 Tax=Auxenochlorella protothecoides TaxID=3075 RepID=A0A1D1ZST8_AUXPR
MAASFPTAVHQRHNVAPGSRSRIPGITSASNAKSGLARRGEQPLHVKQQRATQQRLHAGRQAGGVLERSVAPTEAPDTQLRPVLTAAAWTAADMRAREHEWTYHLTPNDIQELDEALVLARATGKPIHELTQEDFPLPLLAPKLRALGSEVVHGRGFQIIKGVPVERWSREESVTAYWGMGLRWGRAVSNNAAGHLVGHIKDIGHDPLDPSTRLFATRAAQPFHNDAADVVGLLCLTLGESGGLSSWTSSVSVYNAVLAARPDLARLLTQPWVWDRKGEVPPGKPPTFAMPVFNHHAGHLSVNWSSNYFLAAQRHPGVPALTPAHLEAIALVDALAASDALRLDAMLAPGDVQLLSNHTVFHARSAFTDSPERKRHLLRLWLAPEDDRPLPEAYREILGGSVEVGRRGGIVVEGTRLHVPLEAA